MRYCSIDLETTGLDPETCQIIEFAAVLDDLQEQKPVEELPRFQTYVTPAYDNIYSGEPYALSMHPVIFRAIANRAEGFSYASPAELMSKFSAFLLEHGYMRDGKGRIVITAAGKNFGMFDMRFLKRHIPAWDGVDIRHRIIDPAMFFMQPDDDKVPDTATCMKRAGLEGEVAHTATEDALVVVKLIRKGIENLWS